MRDWFECMRAGDFEAAWRINDAFWRTEAPSRVHTLRHFQRIWNGTTLHDRRVLIRCYHGLGDTVQFIRYARLVKAVARETIVWAQPELLELLQYVAGIDRLLPLHDAEVAADYDVDVEVMELPYIFRSTLDTLPCDIPYVQIPRTRRAERNGRPAVGLVWQAGDWVQERSVPTALLAPLFELPHVEWHILQRGAALRELPRDVGVRSGVDDILAFARVLSTLDLLVTVDSFPAHLAGALGVPTWLLLHHTPDWRWLRGRATSPWYPTLRIFQQSAPGGWETLLSDVARELTVAPLRPALS